MINMNCASKQTKRRLNKQRRKNSKIQNKCVERTHVWHLYIGAPVAKKTRPVMQALYFV